MKISFLPTIRGLMKIPKGKSGARITKHLKKVGHGRIDNIPAQLKTELITLGVGCAILGKTSNKLSPTVKAGKKKMKVLYTNKIKPALSKDKKAQDSQEQDVETNNVDN